MKNNPNDKKDIQKQIFEEIKKELPSRFELARTVSKILKVSTDSVYRRIRGEKELSISELITLCRYFNLSFDKHLNEKPSSSGLYQPPISLSGTENYMAYTQNILRYFKSIQSIKEKELIISHNDLSLFHFVGYKELSLFKVFTSTNKMYEYKNFSSFIEHTDETSVPKLFEDLSNTYAMLPSIELWTETSLDSTLRSLELYNSAGFFDNPQTPLIICDQLIQLLNKVELWAERGYKSADPASSSIEIYVSEKNFEASFAMLRSGPLRLNSVFLSTFNSVSSSDPEFCAESEEWIAATISESVKLNENAAKERFKFFHKMKQRVRLMSTQFEKFTPSEIISSANKVYG